MGPAGYQLASLFRNLSAAKQKLLKELNFPELGGQRSQPPRAACVAKVSLPLRENCRLEAAGRGGARALHGTCAILGRLTRFACFCCRLRARASRGNRAMSSRPRPSALPSVLLKLRVAQAPPGRRGIPGAGPRVRGPPRGHRPLSRAAWGDFTSPGLSRVTLAGV